MVNPWKVGGGNSFKEIHLQLVISPRGYAAVILSLMIKAGLVKLGNKVMGSLLLTYATWQINEKNFLFSEKKNIVGLGIMF